MTLTVLLFGATAHAIGSREIKLQIGEGSTASSLTRELLQKYSLLANHKLFIAVNEEYADADMPLKDGDEVAVFTAVSGG